MDYSTGEQKPAQLKEALQQQQEAAVELARAAVDTSKQAVSLADRWVHANAWKLLGVSVGVGLALGVLLGLRANRPAPAVERVPR